MKKDNKKNMKKEERKKLQAELTTVVKGILSKQNVPVADKFEKLVKDHTKVIAKKFTKALSELEVVEVKKPKTVSKNNSHRSISKRRK